MLPAKMKLMKKKKLIISIWRGTKILFIDISVLVGIKILLRKAKQKPDF